MQHYQTLYQSWGPTAIRQMLVNITTDEAQLAKLCTDYKSVFACPAEKCTLTDDVRAIIEAVDLLDYACDHQEAVRTHASCVVGAYTEERMKAQFAPGTSCYNAIDAFKRKHTYLRSDAHSYVSRFPTGGGSSLRRRRRRQLIPQYTENPFPDMKRKWAEQVPASEFDGEAPTCEETLTVVDCLLKPVKDDDCGSAAEALISEMMADVAAKQKNFIKAFAPEHVSKIYPDIGKCLKERENAAAAFFKLFF